MQLVHRRPPHPQAPPRGLQSDIEPDGRAVREKGTLYEGGLRVPFVAAWPGTIPAGGTTDLLAYFLDVLRTIAEARGRSRPGR